jgi:hypothetical protein
MGVHLGWRFRKIFRLGPFRTTWSKKGLGFSWGLSGFRFGVSPDGRRYLSFGLVGTGLYYIKYLDQVPKQQSGQQPPSNQPPALPQHPPQQSNQPWWKQRGLSD